MHNNYNYNSHHAYNALMIYLTDADVMITLSPFCITYQHFCELTNGTRVNMEVCFVFKSDGACMYTIAI